MHQGLSIECYRCHKTVYGQDWLSGGQCAKCNMETDVELTELREKRRLEKELTEKQIKK